MHNNLISEYFMWLVSLVYHEEYSGKASYKNLLTYLHQTDFIYSILTDGNRAEDGMDLRYRFAFERNYNYANVDRYLARPCSVLEMMVALSVRCEEQIMDDPDIGNRTGHWFWGMIVNLGLDSMNDTRFDARFVEEKLRIFLNREYERNGKGGLFTVENCRYDMRNLEIWYQMSWYLSSMF